MQVSTIGVDLAKNVFQVHGVDSAGKAVITRQLRRKQVIDFFRKIPPCLVGMEACGTAHYWAREISKLGHTVRLMPPSYVKGYVKRSKSDAADAAAVCEAVTRPSMRFVPIKSADQQALLMLHRTRDLLIRQRTQARLYPQKHPWIMRLLAKKPAKLVAVAVANKMARIAWTIMAKGGHYRAPELAEAWQWEREAKAEQDNLNCGGDDGVMR